MMAESFGEYARPTDTIAAILGTYPFSVGLFRELLQNSDDARASKQVFVLDSRYHPKQNLFDSKLAGTQGPALLAFNDASFSDEDWEALQSIHRSSKKSDTSKIGKYGIGFRCCYHVTDNPQILSSSSLAILDPHHDFSTSGGTKFNFTELGSKHADHLSCFDFFLSNPAEPFEGSIIRLPLRTPEAQSSLSNKAVDGKEIHTLFLDFIREELDISLLFLKSVKTIEIHEITSDGSRSCLATASIHKEEAMEWDNIYSTMKVSIHTHNSKRDWRVFHASYPQKTSADKLSYRLGRDVRPVLEKHKLSPLLGIAVPLPTGSSEKIAGRLFTYLPLPIKTGFEACHVHGLFALTQSRQNLKNSTEVGIVRGSDDSVLVEWNQCLFDTYLPQTWASLIPVLLRHDNFKDAYRLWPPHQPRVETGDGVYWQMLPAKVLEYLVASKASVWPLLPRGDASQIEYTDLSSAFVASADNSAIDVTVLMALVRAGLKIIRPPMYIFRLLMASFEHILQLLTPDGAHGALLNNASLVKTLRPGERLSLLRYLLSTGNLHNVVGLAITPVVEEDHFIALSSHSETSAVYTLLEKSEYDVFGRFDSKRTISLSSISPPSIAHLLRTDGSTVLNVESITPRRVGQLLRTSPNPFNLDFCKATQAPEAAVDWLAKFWLWFSVTWPDELRAELYALIMDLYLLPSRGWLLERVDRGIFVEDDGADRNLVSVLETLGISFLHPRLSTFVKQSVKDAFPQLLISPTKDVCSVLDRLKLPERGFEAEKDQPLILLAYFSRWIPEACRQAPLAVPHRRTLRSLPIFPVLYPTLEAKKSPRASRFFSSLYLKSSQRTVPCSITSIQDGVTVYGVSNSSSIVSVPVIPDVIFLDGSSVDLGILPHLSDEITLGEPLLPLTEADVLALAVEHFNIQPKELQSVFMGHMVHHRESLPPRILNSLRKVKFIPVISGTLQAPEHAVDPKSPLTVLYAGNGDRIARLDNDTFAKQLRALDILQAKLSAEVILERIQFISAEKESSPKAARAIATRLLDLLFVSGFDCSTIEFPVSAKWLPTNLGFFPHEECLDSGLHRAELFDEVLPVVTEEVQISPSLRKAFGWDKPLPFSVLTQQLAFVIARKGEREAEVTYRKCRALLKELAQRDLSEEELHVVQGITSDRHWIPISSGKLAKTSHAVFMLPFPLSGFYQIPTMFAERHEIRKFLLRMGCTTRPLTSILTAELKSLVGSSAIEQSILILQSLPLELSDEERAELVVPDSEGQFRPVADVYYNDIGDRALFEAGDFCLAHPWIDHEIARHLRIKRIGLKSVLLNNPGINMGEKLITSIRNVLKQYTEQQTLTELLANASDAGADEFKILLDDQHAPASKLLSPLMAPFQTCSSLIVYNNGTFSQTDFEGICRIGVGGKEGKTDSIGQFGLGSLSVYHFCEMATILSGDKLLFLDPSKTHLPIEDWASLLIPLSQMQRLYSDHLAAFDGLFGYQMLHTTYYPGTIFRLPLRTQEHVTDSSILKTIRTPVDVRDNVIRPYFKQAEHSLLFTQINNISTYYRNRSGRLIHGWSLSAKRMTMTEGEFSSRIVRTSLLASPKTGLVHDDWEIATSSTSIADLPSEIKSLIEPHRLRSPIVVGLAARVSRISSTRAYQAHNLFSTLPLPMTTTLPVHLTASFILTPDRRHIRFDDYDNLESKYNRWLLSALTPPLYLFLLESLLHTYGQNHLWWPGNSSQQDSVTRVLVDSFYNDHLSKSKRAICVSMFRPDSFFTASEAIMIGEEAPEIVKVLSLVPNPRFVSLSTIIRERASHTIQALTPLILGETLRQHSAVIMDLFDSQRITPGDIQYLLDFFSQEPKGSVNLVGLPLVPLANGTLITAEPEVSSVVRFVWRPTRIGKPLFHLSRLIRPDFDASSLVDMSLNVRELATAPASLIEELIREHLSETDFLTYPTSQQQEWITLFWEDYPDFKTNLDVSTFPLVRTRHGSYLSISRVNSSPAVIVAEISAVPELLSSVEWLSRVPEWLCSCFDKLGVSIVQRDAIPLPLNQLLPPVLISTFTLLLQYFQAEHLSVASHFLDLDKDNLVRFAEWARTQINSRPVDSLIDVARSLPIWPIVGAGDSVRLQCAKEIVMLPHAMATDIVLHFWNTPVVFYTAELCYLDVPPLTMNEVWTKLSFPDILSPEDRTPYKRLLTTALNDLTFTPEILLVPNGSWKLVPVKTLYARHPLFLSSFGQTSPDAFISQSYVDMENRLAAFGLKGPTNLDLDTFAACATAISNDTGANSGSRLQRARIVFRAYAEDLPLRLDSGFSEENNWKRLSSLRFIPRDPMRQTTMMIPERSPYVKPLPDLVSPSEVLLASHQAVAWTQRAMFLDPPHSRILVSNPDLGKPTAVEVVEHLCVLSLRIAQDHPSNRYLLSDLDATYRWLDDNQDEAADHIIQYHDKPIFLNVDDPKHEPWTWNSADEMFFNDGLNSSQMKTVGKYLEPFRDLLTVAGVEKIVNPIVPITAPPNVQAKLDAFQTGFETMRRKGKLIDVIFITNDGVPQIFPAHRAVLSPMCEYLNNLFCGDFAESRAASSENPVEIEIEYSAACLKVVLDFLYTGSAGPDLNTLELADSLDALDLTQYWGVKELNDILQASIIERNLINPETYEEILERARELDAKLIVVACTYYAQENKDVIRRLRGEQTGPRRPQRLPKKTNAFKFQPVKSDGWRKLKPTKMRIMMRRVSGSLSKSASRFSLRRSPTSESATAGE